ncbi:SpaA isopeptide-forming pilin-related protein [Butyrivibrio sp. XPD2002]|uniref:SpaA isopeptide-forming pilin-related protein n=1 Tax=Butyrivibrio sp. XPD2002 TaxID=1280665 RepID=UPI000404FDA4|nr:SpaA isopeptide-forming pilin-related protein [Butyrivibrio sp. XPD2002]
MKKVNLREDRKGFTIAELLIVIAIIIILMAFGFIAGMRLIRNMRQSHLDKRAEAVYYAAESRMMELFVTEEKTEKKEDKKVKAVVEKLYNAKTFNYEGATLAYITSEDVGEAKNLFAEDNSLEAEIKSASWIIEYDPVSLNVFAVILSDDLEKAGTSIAGLSESPSGAPVRGTPQDRIAAFDAYVGYYSEGANGVLGASAKNGLSVGAWILNRRDLLGVIKITADENTRAAIENLSFRISLKGTKSTSDGDEVDISSNEIYWQNYAGDSGSNFLESDGRTGIVITTNDVRNTIPVSCFGDTTDSNDKYGLIGYIKLDSLDIDRQFKDLKVKGGGALGDYITPGDDITMSVKVWDSSDGNSNYSQNVRRTSAISNTENSLYADFDVEGANGVAKIVYPRHLQNLAAEFSEVKAEMAAGNSNPGSMDAVLLEDITWDEEKNLYKQGGSLGVIRNFTPISNTQLVSFNGYRFETAKSAQPLRNIEDATKENPEEVNLKSSKKENKYHYITGLRIDTSDSSYRIVGNPADIGLFGKQSNLTLANLVLTNFDIKNNNAGGTGMLAGELDNSKIKNVLIYEKKDANKVITGAGDTAGVVGVLNSSSIEDCVIKNISVKTTAGSAGALAGKASSSEIKNTLAYNGEITGVEGSNTPGTTVGFDDSKLEITGGKNAGGLIGEMDGGSVTGAAAALYVRATGGNAGGFVGSARGASIDMCHSGGHTVTLDNKIGRYDKVQSDGSKGRVNVIGSSNAGGFAGKLDGASVQNSYSTCSATAGTVGGFVGASSGGTISKSYAVGQVFFTNAASAGGFAGSLGGAGVSDDHYFEIINPTEDGKYLQGVGNVKKDAEGLKAIDKPLEKGEDEYEYNKFMLAAADLTMARQDKTHRYDSELQPAIFAMPFCSQLKDVASSDMFFVEAHYGDWPIVETHVINADSSARVRFTMSDPFAVIKAFASDLSKSDILRSLAEEVITTPIPEEDLAENKDSSEEQAPAEEEEKAEEIKEEETQPEEQVEETTSEESETQQEETRQDEVLEENTEAPSEEPATEEAKDETATETAEPQEEKPADETAAEAPTEDKEKEDQDLIEEQSYAMVVGEEEEEPEDDSIEGRLEAEGSGVAITFGKDAEIPEGSELQVTYITEDSEDYDYSQLISDATEAMEIDSEEVASYKAIDIAIMKDGEEIQPKAPVDVEIKAENFYENKELFLDDEVTAVHIKEDDPEVIGTELKKDETEKNSQAEDENPAANESADFVNFTADGFSVYVLVQPISAKKVVTSDDSTYQITVDYDNASGIPADAELVVVETTCDSAEYAGIVEESAKELGTYSEYVKGAHVFDISFVNPETGDTYQPVKDVKVSVELMQEEVDAEDEEIKVVHFGEANEVLRPVVNEGQIEFTTGGFSTYTIIKLPTFDVFDTALDGEKYYISYEDTTTDPATKYYLFIDGSTSPVSFGYTDDAAKATAWNFELFGKGYRISNGTNYLSNDGTDWMLGTETNASEFTSTDWGDYHLLCLAESNLPNKYLGYGAAADHLDMIANTATAHMQLTVAVNGTDIEDKSYHGRSFYITGSGYFLTYKDGSTYTQAQVPTMSTEWTFILDDHGYKIHNGQKYVGIENGQVVFTKASKGAQFKVVDLGEYHLLEYYDETASIPGYNGQYLNIGRAKDSQFGIAATDPSNPAETAKMLLINDITIEGNYAMYLTKAPDKFAVADVKVTQSGRGDMLRADNIKGIVNETTGQIVETASVKINATWNFEKGENKFEHYIKVASGTQVGKYLNLVWDGGKSHLRLTDTKQALTIATLPNGQIRIFGGSNTAPLAVDYSNGGKNFQAYEFLKGSDGTATNEWFNIAEVSTLTHYTLHYTYPKEVDDVGYKNNLPAATTEFVSGNASDTTGPLQNYELKAPTADKYYSYDDNWKYTYEFVGWKIAGLTGIHDQQTFIPTEIIDLVNYMEGLTPKIRPSGSTINIKAVWKLVKKEKIEYKVIYQMFDAEPGYGTGIIGDKLPDIVDLPYDAGTSYLATETVAQDDIKKYSLRNIGYKDGDGKYWISYQEKTDPDGYFPNRNVRTYQRYSGSGDLTFYHTYLFMGWETETGAVLSAYDLDHNKRDLSKYDENLDGTIELKVVWSYQWAESGNSNPSVNLSVLRNADQIDNPNNANQFLTEDRSMYIHIDGATMYQLDENGYPVAHTECRAPSKRPYKYFMQYIIDENTVTRTEKDIVRADKAVRRKLAGSDGYSDSGAIDETVHDKYESESTVGPVSDNVDKGHTWQISYLPSDERVFDYLSKKSTRDIFIYNEITGRSEKINKSELTPDKYMIRWVVVKYQSGDSEIGWHINAKITKKISCVTVTKTFKGNADNISKLMDGIEQIQEGDSESEISRKVDIAKKKFNITLKNNANPDEVLYLTLLNRVTNNAAISKTGMAKVANDTFGYVDYKEKTDSNGNITGTYTWLITFDDEKTFSIKENNYDDRDPVTGKSTFGTELTYNQTNTGASDDGEEKQWDPEIPVKTSAEPTDNTDYEDNFTTNLTNNIKPISLFRIKKINDKKEGIKDVKFKVYLKGSDDPIRLYYRNDGENPDGNYNVLYENNKSEFYALTNDKGFLNLYLAWPQNEPIVYTIQEEIPEGYQGHEKYAPKFEVEVKNDGTVSITKSKIDMPPSYGMVEPYAITENGTEDVWTKKPYEKVGEEQIAICNGALVTNSSGVEIALKKISGKADTDGKAERLGEAQFTFYDATKEGDNNSLASVVDGSATEYKNIILKNGDDEEVATVVKSTDSADEKGNLIFKIPAGIYYMKETTAPAKYEPDYYVEEGKDPDDEENHLQYIYRIYVGEDYVKQAVEDVRKDTGKTLDIVENGENQTMYVIVRMDKDDAAEKIDTECIQKNRAVIGDFGIIDLSKEVTKVVLKKVGGDGLPLTGPKFEIYRSDGLRILNGENESWTAGAAGAFYIGKLSVGTYFLHETANGGAGSDCWIRIDVEKDEGGTIKVSEPKQISGSPFKLDTE